MFIQIGTAAVRAPDGRFINEEPIYRHIEDPAPNCENNLIDFDRLGEIFADKAEAYIKKQRLNNR